MFSGIKRLSTAIIAGGNAIAGGLLYGIEAPQAQVQDEFTQLRLPVSGAHGTFRSVEWSNDLEIWQAMARDYGFSWENIFPEAISVLGDDQGQFFLDSPPEGIRYYRIVERNTENLDNARSISRFLQQATFGPNQDQIYDFPGLNSSQLNVPPYDYYEAWIDIEMAKPVFSLRKYWRERSNPEFVDNLSESPDEVGHNPAYGHQFTYNIGQEKFYPDPADAVAVGRSSNDVSFSPQETKQIVWYQAAITGPDALRQRVAWSLSQLFVVGEEGSNQIQASEKYLSYYDIFVRHAFGNFRDILGEVTYHPVMGYYLTFVDNKKEDTGRGIFPDENYAREILQLFTIGLWMLNQDGTLILDEAGEPVPTYDNEDIQNLARIFTGLRRQSSRDNIEIIGGNYVDPMRIQVSWHDFTQKVLLDGSTHGPFPYSEEGVRQDIDGLLDHLVNHPNVPPFVARFLIQRLTISNPSPGYIEDVAQAFIDGSYNERGSGIRGDLAATIRAILLHTEAREATLSGDTAHGKLREPLIRLLHYARAFNITSPQTYGLFPFYQLDLIIDESPFNFPSVFSYYLPEYQPSGDILDAGIFAPEFQIHTDITSINLYNAIRTLVYEGISDEIGRRGYSQGDLDLSEEIEMADDVEFLLFHLDLMLTAGRLTPANRAAIFDAIDSMPDTSEDDLEERVKRALSLFSLLPEFNVLY